MGVIGMTHGIMQSHWFGKVIGSVFDTYPTVTSYALRVARTPYIELYTSLCGVRYSQTGASR